MRYAKFQDYLKKLEIRTPAHSAISQLDLDSNTFNISNIHIISGQNGSGKSSLLKFLAGLQCNVHASAFQKLSFKKTISTIEDDIDESLRFQYLSPSWLIEENARGISELKSGGQFEELIAGHSSFIFSSDLLELVNYILNTQFTTIKIYELENTVAQLDNTPYDTNDKLECEERNSIEFLEGKLFYLESNNTGEITNSIALSQGEQYIILLSYLLYTRKGRSILIDEPETYLSPLSQYRLANVLVYFSVSNKLQFILATHSICFIESFDIENTMMVEGVHLGHIQLESGKSVSSHLRRLGYKVPKENIALFEDQAAADFFSNIIKCHDTDWLSSLELIPLSGESDIIEILKRINNYRILGIFDADQKGKTDPSRFKGHFVTFLPGTLAPEEELIACIKNNIADFSEMTGIPVSDLNTYMRQVLGVDHHDYFTELSKITQKGKNEVFNQAFAVWQKHNASLITEFISELTSIYSTRRSAK